MAITLTVGTNTWVTLAEANSYMESKWGADDWSSLSDDNKKKLLITAFEWINSEPDYDISTVTDSLKKAQIELAWFIYENNDVYEKHELLWASGVRDFDISKFSETLKEPMLPLKVQKLLSEYNYNAGGYFPTIDREVDQNQ